jgi:hypothetical protein
VKKAQEVVLGLLHALEAEGPDKIDSTKQYKIIVQLNKKKSAADPKEQNPR